MVLASDPLKIHRTMPLSTLDESVLHPVASDEYSVLVGTRSPNHECDVMEAFNEFGFFNYPYGLLHLSMMRRFCLSAPQMKSPSRSSFIEPRQGTNQQLIPPKNDAHKMTNYVGLLEIIIVLMIIQNDGVPAAVVFMG